MISSQTKSADSAVIHEIRMIVFEERIIVFLSVQSRAHSLSVYVHDISISALYLCNTSNGLWSQSYIKIETLFIKSFKIITLCRGRTTRGGGGGGGGGGLGRGVCRGVIVTNSNKPVCEIGNCVFICANQPLEQTNPSASHPPPTTSHTHTHTF